MRRLAAVAAVVLGLLVCLTGAALAEAPIRVDDQITDKAGALGTDPSRVQAALDKLSADTPMQLYVVYVVSFSGRNGQDWADQAAQMSQLGRNDALLAVATGDRAYGISLDDRFPLSDTVVSGIEDDDVRPKLSSGDFAGAAIAMADGLRNGGPAARSGGGGLTTGLLVGGAAVVGGGAYVLARRRRRSTAGGATATDGAAPPVAPAPDPAPGEPTSDLAYRASAAL